MFSSINSEKSNFTVSKYFDLNKKSTPSQFNFNSCSHESKKINVLQNEVSSKLSFARKYLTCQINYFLSDERDFYLIEEGM
jgi:hypothetical protein